MKIKLPVSKLTFLEDNPRKISEDNLKKLIRDLNKDPKFLEKRPLLVNRINGKNIVYAGNMRLRAARQDGWTEIWCDIDENLDLNVMRERVLRDNVEYGENDHEILNDKWADLVLNMDLPELVLESVDLSEPETEEDDFEPPKEPKYKVEMGDVFQLGEHRLMCGDSTKIEDVEKLMDGEKADMVFSDPPYGISCLGKGIDGVKKGNNFGKILNDDSTEVAISAFNLCKSLKISKQVWWGANYYCSHLEDGYGWIVWDKQKEGDIFSGFEIAFCNNGIKSRIYRYRWHGMIRDGEIGEKTIHPTQKPIALCANIINDIDGNLILDLFGGSGSTLIACEQLGRRCFMMELDPYYCSVIIKRWEKLTNKRHKKI